MSKERKRWLIKSENGQIIGPFTIDQVLRRIEEGEFSGDEYISVYPGGKWHLMSQEPHFYDRLLDSLSYSDAEESPAEKKPVQNEDFTQSGEKLTRDVPVDEILSGIGSTKTLGYEDDEEKTRVMDGNTIDGQEISDVEDILSSTGTNVTPSDRSSSDTRTVTNSPKKRTKVRGKKKKKSRHRSKRRAANDGHSVIELVNVGTEIWKERFRAILRHIFFVVLISGIGIYFFLESDGNDSRERIHLVSLNISDTAEPFKNEKLIRLFQSGLTEFYKGTRSSYVRAQNYWIQAIEGSPKQLDLWPWLCMAYYELWPYSYQDSKDFEVISMATRHVNKMDPVGPEGGLCRVVKLLVQNKFVDANGLVSIVLDTFDQQSDPPVLYYYIKAKILRKNKKYSAALGYLGSVLSDVPNWLGASEEWADNLHRMGKSSEAAQKYYQIIGINPGHKMARLHLGIIEFRIFKHTEKALNILTVAIEIKEGANPGIESEAHLILAEIYTKQDLREKALKSAQRSYALNSRNVVAKNLILQIDGPSGLSKVKLKDQHLVYEGDQFKEEGNCQSAVGFYRRAHEINNKNGIAAKKAAQCYWKMSLSSQALKWLNLAIKSEPDLVDSYVLLADFYSQKYDYLSAARILRKAERVLPDSHEVLRGFALLELRRENPVQAIEYAKRSIKKYEGDVDSHLIMAKSYILMKNYQEGYSSVTRAVELDANNRKAQIVYGKALAGLEGVETAVDYYTKLVSAYPSITDYRLVLAQLLLDDEQFERAETLFGGVIKYNPKAKKALMGLAKIKEFHKEYEQADQYYLEAALIDPSEPTPLFEAGVLALGIGKARDATSKFKRVVRINPRFPLVYYYIGKAALALGNPTEAIAQSNYQLKINPHRPEPYLLSAEAHAHPKVKQYSICSREYQRALKFLDPGADIFVKMSKCYRMAGNYDVAKSMLIQATKVENGFAPIYREFGLLAIANEELEQAQKFFAQYFELDPNASDRKFIDAQLSRAINQQ